MARGSDERNLFKSFTSDQGGLSCKGFEALSKLKQSHIKIYFCIFLDCSQINIYLPFNFNFSKPTSRNRHNADIKYNCVHLKQIHQHIRVKSSSTINRLLCPWTGLISQRGSSWKWQGWGTFSGSLDPSRSRSSAAWWRRRPSSLLAPAPRLRRARSPQPASNFQWNLCWNIQLDKRVRQSIEKGPEVCFPRRDRSDQSFSPSSHELGLRSHS